MVSHIGNINFKQLDYSAMKTLVELYIANQTPTSIYQDIENVTAVNNFFDEHTHLWRILYRYEDKIFHMYVFTLLIVHFQLDPEEVKDAICCGTIMQLAFETIEETDYIKSIIG